MKRKLNVKLLRKIQAHITEEPRRFFMDECIIKASTPEEWVNAAEDHWDASKTMPPCGTAACISGWTNILTRAKSLDQYQDFDRAIASLGIVKSSDFHDWTGADYLFLAECWPKQFSSRYKKAKTPKTRAKIACERINYLIATGK